MLNGRGHNFLWVCVFCDCVLCMCLDWGNGSSVLCLVRLCVQCALVSVVCVVCVNASVRKLYAVASID